MIGLHEHLIKQHISNNEDSIKYYVYMNKDSREYYVRLDSEEKVDDIINITKLKLNESDPKYLKNKCIKDNRSIFVKPSYHDTYILIEDTLDNDKIDKYYVNTNKTIDLKNFNHNYFEEMSLGMHL